MERIADRQRSGDPRGFTAIEITMVASIIAIIAMLVLPLFRNRVDAAKKAACQADLASLMKAEELVKADTGYFVRLEDLDNIVLNTPTPVPPQGINLETPPFHYNTTLTTWEPMTETQWRAFSGPKPDGLFKGPYIAFRNSITYQELVADMKLALLLKSTTDPAWPSTSGGGFRGPIWDIPQSSGKALYDHRDNRYPVDPWGNPYLFFPATDETETGYGCSIIYSLGPDGKPGLAPGTSASDYYRGAHIGETNSDEKNYGLMVQF